MGGPAAWSIGHTWHGLDPAGDFARHPEWFALSGGVRTPSKPCYSHPEVIERAIAFALAEAERGAQRGKSTRGKPMVSMSPPDGLGYCECERCLAACGGGDTLRDRAFRERSFLDRGTLFFRREDGSVASVASETLFAFVNRVAAAASERRPGTLIGCYAYSAYAHPPSFDLHPAVYVQVASAFRRTPLSLEEQLREFGAKTPHLGIREYFGVYQWDWDLPDPGNLEPETLARTLRSYRSSGVTAVNAEASCNWGPRGLGYYLAAQLLWDIDADPSAILRDFYDLAFGPAALPMQRYYALWYGPAAAVLPDPRGVPPRARPAEAARLDPAALRDALRDALEDLDEAARLASGRVGYQERVDHLRLYAHSLVLRAKLEEAEASGDPGRILDAIREETVFSGRLAPTNLVHARALLGKAFLRRFRKHEALLAGEPLAGEVGKGWRQAGTPPDREELERLWAEDLAWATAPSASERDAPEGRASDRGASGHGQESRSR